MPFKKSRELVKKIWNADHLLCPRCQHEMASRTRKLDLPSAFRYETSMETLLAAGIDGQPPETPRNQKKGLHE